MDELKKHRSKARCEYVDAVATVGNGKFSARGDAEAVIDIINTLEGKRKPSVDDDAERHDRSSLYRKAIDIVRTDRKSSVRYLQRKLNIGYNVAATLIERMEEKGIISKPNSDGKREILI